MYVWDLFAFKMDALVILETTSLMAVGLAAYTLAFITLAIISLIFPPFIQWRKEGYLGWRKLQRIAFLTLFITAGLSFLGMFFEWQSFGMSQLIMFDNQTVFFVGSGATCLAGAYLAYWLAIKVGNWGLGHGVSLLFIWHFFLNLCSRRFEVSSSAVPQVGTDRLLQIGSFALVVGLIYALMRLRFGAHGDANHQSRPVFSALPGGLIGWQVLFVMQRFFPDAVYNAFRSVETSLIIVISLSVVLGFFFNMHQYPYRKQGHPYGLWYRREFWLAQGVGVIIPCVFILVLPMILPTYAQLSPGDVIALFFIVAITMDYLDEGRLWWQHPRLEAVGVFQQLVHVDSALLRLRAMGVPAVARARNHRALLHFLGFYLEMTVLVPAKYAARAHACIQQHYPWAQIPGEADTVTPDNAVAARVQAS